MLFKRSGGVTATAAAAAVAAVLVLVLVLDLDFQKFNSEIIKIIRQ